MEFSHLVDGLKTGDYGLVGVPNFAGNPELVELSGYVGTVRAEGRTEKPSSSSAVWKLSKATSRMPTPRRYMQAR